MLKPITQDAAETPDYRLPPRNIEAEMGLLGAILVNNRAYERVSELLRPEHFAEPVHQKIYAACAAVIERGQHADPTTMRHYLESDEAFASAGGVAYLARLAREAITVINASHYAALIHDLYLRRELIELGTDVVNDAYEADVATNASTQIEKAEQSLYDLATTGEYAQGFRTFSSALAGAIDMAQSAFHREGHVSGLSSGFKRMDLMLGGLHPSDLVVLAARPAMGKTALATNIAFNVAKTFQRERDESGVDKTVDGGVIGFFSLEMSAEQLATRIISEEAQIPSDKIRKGEVTATEFERLVQASQKLEAAPFFIDDTPALSVSGLRTRARRLKRQRGLDLIVVDYIQLLQGSPTARNENRVQEISEITRGLKTLAKELNVPVLALSQLSRAVEQREDKRPQLADLRESGTIEQDADVVLFIFREEYYLSRQEPIRRAEEGDDKYRLRLETWQANMDAAEKRAEVIIGKQRHGPTGKIELMFHDQITRFDEPEDLEHEGDVPF